ncbi:chemotaxis protein CheA [Methyloferula stellata]|uniref:chemotaxis protein CheA n=1 Tax=Methyloferula stellata TaxID=876270 RepID=UPI00036A61EB|nr:chemotaxis protein CheA [Methyloferula stellata]
MDAMAVIKQTFFQECEEQLAELETGLLAIENGDHDQEIVNAVFRAVHSIKGGAGAFSLDDLVHFAHIFENTLDLMRSNRLQPTPDVVKTMLRAADVLADLVRAARDDGDFDNARTAALAQELAALGNGGVAGSAPAAQEKEEEGDLSQFRPRPIAFNFDEEPAAPAEPEKKTFSIRFKPKPDLYAKANESALLLREIERLGEATITCDMSELPLLSELDPEGAYLAWTVELKTDADEAAIREVFEFVEWDCDLEIEGDEASAAEELDVLALIRKVREAVEPETPVGPEASATEATAKAREPEDRVSAKSADALKVDQAKGDHASSGPQQTTIRVDLDRVDRLIDLVGELVINQAMLAQRVTEAGLARGSDVTVGLDELEQLTRGIQDSVMAIRAQPVKSVFQRMPRLVREVAALTGKSVRLFTEGENTEVDKTVIERLADPLTHMIRNAIDHGLEKPEKRVAAGKPEEGLVRLSAAHRSGRIVIEVADDGAGIDRARVRASAVNKGLIAADAQLSDDEIDNLIFLPGFSTAEKVSDISGRGVGMDVVKRSIQALGGRISITSKPGQGSVFTLSLPLTLAVLDGMVVTVAGQTLVVPLTAIVETLQPKGADVHGFGGGARVIAIRNMFTPLIDVGRELGYRNEAADPLTGVALLVESEGSVRSALLVDAIQGQRQVVIKSLEANYRHVHGIAAATILGDGRVALILDVDAVVANSRAEMTAYLEPHLALAG